MLDASKRKSRAEILTATPKKKKLEAADPQKKTVAEK